MPPENGFLEIVRKAVSLPHSSIEHRNSKSLEVTAEFVN